MTDETVFAAALEKQSPAERSAFLDEACADDPALRQRVEALLQAHDKAGDYLEQPAVEQMAADGDPAQGATAALDTAIRPESVSPPTEPGDDEKDAPLDFLQPSTKPGSLGRLGHLRGAGGARPRRLRHRAEGVRRAAAPRRRHQGPGPAAGRHLPGPQALPARGPRRRRRPPRERRRHPRRRGAADPLPGHGVHRRRDLAADELDRIGPLDVAEVLRIGRQIAERPGGGPRAGADPPRHQAGQHPAGKRRRAASRSPTSAWPAPPTTPA